MTSLVVFSLSVSMSLTEYLKVYVSTFLGIKQEAVESLSTHRMGAEVKPAGANVKMKDLK